MKNRYQGKKRACSMNPDQMPVEQLGHVRNWPEFQRELGVLIGKHDLQEASGLPVDALSEYLTQCLVALNIAVLTTRPGETGNVAYLR
jgi:hypothetical protein